MDPESSPPSPMPDPLPPVELSGPAYYAELAKRVEGHIAERVIGEKAKKEIGYAVEVLRMLGGGDAT